MISCAKLHHTFAVASILGDEAQLPSSLSGVLVDMKTFSHSVGTDV